MATLKVSTSGSHEFVIAVLICSIIVTNSLIILSEGETKVFLTELTVTVTVGLAMSLALTLVYRQKLQGPYVKKYLSLAIGLTLWFCGFLLVIIAKISLYYQLGFLESWTFPSPADGFWLSGYVFFAYFLFRTYYFLSKMSERYIIIMVSIATALILGYILNLTFGIAKLLSSQQDISLLLVSIAYPILDGLLAVPAIVIIWTLRSSGKDSIHWMLLSVSLVLITIGDIGFGYSAVLSLDILQKQQWIWTSLYNAGYLSVATALFLYNKFYIFSQKNIQCSDLEVT